MVKCSDTSNSLTPTSVISNSVTSNSVISHDRSFGIDTPRGFSTLARFGLLLVLLVPSNAAAEEAAFPEIQGSLTQALQQGGDACRSLQPTSFSARHGRLSFSLNTPQAGAETIRVDLQPEVAAAFCFGGGVSLSYVGPQVLTIAPCLIRFCGALEADSGLVAGIHQAIQAQQQQEAPLALVATDFSWNWILLAAALLVAAAWLILGYWKEPLMTRGTPVAASLILLLAVTALVNLAWDGSWAIVPWLLLPLLAVVAWVRGIRSHGTKALLVLAITAGSLALRLAWDWLPINWYYDFTGPDQATQVFLRRTGGASRFFEILNWFVPITPQTFFVVSAWASSLGASLLALSILPTASAEAGSGTKEQPRGTCLAWAVLLALDPLQLVLGASGAVHTWALLAFASGFYWYRAWRSGPRDRATLNLSLALISTALVGWTRPELAWYALAYPVMDGLAKAERAQGSTLPRPSWILRIGSWVLLAIAVAAGLLPSLAREHGYATIPVDWDTVGAWAHSLVPPFLPSAWLVLGDQDFNPMATQILFSVLFGAFITGSILGKRWYALLLLPTMALLTLPRLATPFSKFFLVGPLPTWRYDILLSPMLLLTLALGAGFLVRWFSLAWTRFPRWDLRAALVAGCLAAAAAALVQHPLLNGSLRARDPLPFQREYSFLKDSMRNIAPGATVVVPWLHGWEEEPAHDIDAVLAVPHTLIAFQRPDIRWVVLEPGAHSLPSTRPLFWFQNAFCSLDLDSPHGILPPEAAQRFASLLGECRRQSENQALRWTDRQLLDVSPTGGVIQVDGPKIILGLGQLKRGF